MSGFARTEEKIILNRPTLCGRGIPPKFDKSGFSENRRKNRSLSENYDCARENKNLFFQQRIPRDHVFKNTFLDTFFDFRKSRFERSVRPILWGF